MRVKWLIGLGMLLSTSTVWAQEGARPDERLDIPAIQRAIEAEGLRWTAGETSMTALSPEARRCKILPQGVAPPRAYEEAPAEPQAPKVMRPGWGNPGAMDWRDIGGYSFLPELRDQGSCGACWAFSTIGTLEPLIAFRRSESDPEIDLSEQQVLDCAASLGCDSGGFTWVTTGAYMHDEGATSESCYPYTAGDTGQKGSCIESAALGSTCQQAVETIDEAVDLWNTAPDMPIWDPPPYTMSDEAMAEVKAYLHERPVGTSMRVFSDFYAYTGGVYSPSSSASSGGLHAVVFVGYNDAGGYWIVRNSWGDDWGEGGYFRIAYNTSSIGMFSFVQMYQEEVVDPAFCDITPSVYVSHDAPSPATVELRNCGAGVLPWSVSIDNPELHLEADGLPVTGGYVTGRGKSFELVASDSLYDGDEVKLTFSSPDLGSHEVRVFIDGNPYVEPEPEPAIEVVEESADLYVDQSAEGEADALGGDADSSESTDSSGGDGIADPTSLGDATGAAASADDEEGSCACSGVHQPGASSSGVWSLFFAAGLFLLRRKRRQTQ